ncbi:hypothetical protein PG637_07110 [Riemerella anatipestifer]|uniref:hypothetical protein n=1 Tax=Riemerella anatipestifer TaxID=34085 RepID=UPI00129D42B5|nr:hypothetical protein [Riemerella anatipestifer]MDY3319348.1 hypothetical protein [Riemerella anatipestifer]MDY3325436.1 hypothetical protein [Riemerella anatipestifer]MDY3354161.1 hypothetical protein [Riemerella anatipestifer]MRM83882.1 hypothetical protein [Riemerella anatipestifer]
MKYQITDKFSRIGLHDSHFSNISFDKDSIAINIDWGFLENFEEEKIREAIVFDEAELYFSGIKSQTFKKITNDNSIQIDFPNSLCEDNWLIMTNECIDNINEFSMVITMTNYEQYIEWIINFESGQLTWDKFILHKNWLNGQEKL